MEKKKYIAPELKCVEFEVELGFATSTTLTQGFRLRPQGEEPTYQGGRPFQVSNGYFGGNNDDWD